MNNTSTTFKLTNPPVTFDMCLSKHRVTVDAATWSAMTQDQRNQYVLDNGPYITIRFPGNMTWRNWLYTKWQFVNTYGVNERGLRILGVTYSNWSPDLMNELNDNT